MLRENKRKKKEKFLFCPNSSTRKPKLGLVVALGFAHISRTYPDKTGCPGDSDGKESACSAGDQGSIPWLGRSPGEGNGCPLQYSCLENPMERGAWWATVHGVTKNQTRLSD